MKRAGPRVMEIRGAGLVTDAHADIGALAADIQGDLSPQWRQAIMRVRCLEPHAIAQHDVLAQLAVQAAHQACSMAGMLDQNGKADGGEKVGVLFVSHWGTIDSTVGYLESMLEAQGRYASPRHFSRSVFSSVAAVMAIHFAIHGPCETLCFPWEPVTGGLQAAWRLLSAGRCGRAVVVWGEQAAEIAGELAKIAHARLHRREYARYAAEGLGFGAAAVVLSPPAASPAEQGLGKVSPDLPGEVQLRPRAGRPFPMDGAVGLIERIMRQIQQE